jgi:tRNA 5-methylaminomethyl-2-thiouridine biosynthesis bifunctional protein
LDHLSSSSIVIIGAGIAGASIARQFASRGMAVTVLERDQPASGGSGNPVAVVRPEPGGADNPIAEFSAAGVHWLQDWLARHGASVPHAFCGAFRMTRDQRRHDKLIAYAETRSRDEIAEFSGPAAAQLCGQAPAGPGFFLPQAGWLDPVALVHAFLDHPLIHLQTSEEAIHLDKCADGSWQVTLSESKPIVADRVVVATAYATELSPVPLAVDRARGQLSVVPEQLGRSIHVIVCRDGYITPAIKGLHTIGATIQYDDEDASPRAGDDLENFQRLQRLLPGFVNDPEFVQSGRVAWRATTQDRLPMVGKIADGLYVSIGHGSRGIACAPLCAELLVAEVCDEPLPMAPEWLRRLDPLRFNAR